MVLSHVVWCLTNAFSFCHSGCLETGVTIELYSLSVSGVIFKSLYALTILGFVVDDG